jgi:hypothetical protein
VSKIYFLADPRDYLPRYVGQTSSTLKRRLSGHRSDSKRAGRGYRNSQWIKSLLSEGISPEINLLEDLSGEPQEYIDYREKYWITFFKSKGNDLTNYESGGKRGGSYKKKFCIRNHEMINDNLYVDPSKNRHCVLCRKERVKSYKQKPEYKDARREQNRKYYEKNKQKK